jgi:hypothetical protein
MQTKIKNKYCHLFNLLYFILLASFSLCLKDTNAQVCSDVITSKYVTLTEKIVGSAKITGITSHSVVAVPGGFWIGGLATVAGGNVEFYYAKADDTGKLLFFKTIGLASNEGGYAIKLAATPSGGVIITGQNYDATLTTNLGAIVSIDNQGGLKWYKKTASNGNSGATYLDAIRGVTVEPNGDVVCVGDAQQYSKLNYSRILIVKLDSSGNQLFANQINVSVSGNNQQTHPIDIKSTSYGYVIAGWTTSTQNPFVMLVDKSTGKAIQGVYLSAATNYSTDNILTLPSGKVFIAGFTNKNGNPDGFVAALNIITGNVIWQKGFSVGAGSTDYFNHAYLENGKIYLSVQSNGLGGGGQRQGFVTLDTNGNYISGNAIYFGTRRMSISNSANDFDILKSGGTVFFGQDNGAAGVRLNFALLSPCLSTSCANHTQTYTPFATTLSPTALTTADVAEGNLTNHTPTITSINFNSNIECRQPCKKPTQLLIDTTLLCTSKTSVNVDATQTLTTCTYLWDDGDVNPKKSFTSSGTYFLTTTNACSSIIDTLTVIAGDIPTSPSFKDTTFCNTGWSLYKNIKQIGCTYIWDNGSTKSYRTFTVPGNFWLETSNSCGKRVDTIKIKQGSVVVMPPKLQDTGICIGETIIVNIAAKPFHTYLWSDGDTNATRGFKTFGKYFLTVSTPCQTKQDSFNILLRRKPIKAPIKDTVFCASPILYSLNAFQPNCIYVWSDGTTNPSITVNRTGKWWLITENRCGNRIDSFKVDKDTIPVKVLNDNEYFCQGQPLKIKAYQPNIGKFNYSWSNGDKGAEISIPYSTTISLVTSNSCGTRTDFVNVHSYRCDCSMWVPSAFSPRNSDNLNDGWAPYFECQVRSGYYSIYNRWGECIVFQKSVLDPWDGKLANGEYAPEGVYAYIVHGLYAESITGTRTFDQFGDLTIINGKK